MYLEEKFAPINMSIKMDDMVACPLCWGTCSGKCQGCEGCKNTAKIS